MKHLAIVLAVALIAIRASAQEKIFNEVAAIDNVTSVYISPAMLRLAGSSQVVTGKMGGLSTLTKDLQSVELLSSDDYVAVSRAVPICKRIIKSNGMSELAVIKEAGNGGYAEEVSIYADSDTTCRSEGMPVRRVVIMTSSGEEFSLISLEGLLDLTAVMNAYQEEH